MKHILYRQNNQINSKDFTMNLIWRTASYDLLFFNMTDAERKSKWRFRFLERQGALLGWFQNGFWWSGWRNHKDVVDGRMLFKYGRKSSTQLCFCLLSGITETNKNPEEITASEVVNIPAGSCPWFRTEAFQPCAVKSSASCMVAQIVGINQFRHVNIRRPNQVTECKGVPRAVDSHLHRNEFLLLTSW